YGASYDLASRRKNATRESTATLKAWLSEHKKNPYPTKGEKIMLAIITKMTLTQVSTWFANARRRLKKDNKMTWEPKNRTEDEDEDALASDDEKPRHSEDISMNSVGCAERRRPLGMEYPGGAINVSLANNVAASGNGTAGTTNAATTGAGVMDGSVSGVGATIAAAATAATAVSSSASTATSHHPHVVGGASVGAVGAIQPGKEVLDIVQLSRVHSPQLPAEQPSSAAIYQSYESPKYTTMTNPYITNGYSYVKEELLYNSNGRPRFWSLTGVGAEEKPILQLGNGSDINTMSREWPTNYTSPTYAPATPTTMKQTSVVATISMQPTSPHAQVNGQQRYGGGGGGGQLTAVTPPQTPPNQLHTFAGAFPHGGSSGSVHTANRDVSAYNIGRSEELRSGCAPSAELYCKGQDCA
ncbi:unnamed protein product, partial [Ceratitis capitata]